MAFTGINARYIALSNPILLYKKTALVRENIDRNAQYPNELIEKLQSLLLPLTGTFFNTDAYL